MAQTSELFSILDSIQDGNFYPLIALSLLPFKPVEGGIFSRITMTSMTGAWYLPLGHFEALLVALIVLEIFVMRYFLILPLDVSKLIGDGTLLATSVSRKKRMALDYKEVFEQQMLAESMFTVLRRLDKDDCVLRTLCELEFGNSIGEVYPARVTDLLKKLKRLGHHRLKRESMITPNNVTISFEQQRKVLSEFEDAVLFGTGDNALICETHSNESCASQYSLCSANRTELLNYVDKIFRI